jgi:proline dehydrogenase
VNPANDLLRKSLLWASTQPWLRERAVRTAFVRRSVRRFMPGEEIGDAIAAARELQPRGLTTILTHLGENLEDLAEATEVRAHYVDVVNRVRAAGLDAHISVKPTQLGHDQDPEVCVRHCEALLDHCVASGSFLWLDMESSPYVDGTLALYRRLRARSEKVGVAIQSYLRRTPEDIDALVELGAAIRLVKGAYLEPPEVAFPDKRDVDRAYYDLAERILTAAPRPGALLHIATHDIDLQERLRAVIAEHQVDPERYEVAMLYGIQSGRQEQLAADGVRTRCLISYGRHWFPWYMRRLAERPANVWFVARSMFRR